MPRPVRIFLASSKELVEHRRAIRLRLAELNKRWMQHGLLLEAVHWEDFSEVMAPGGSQAAYNRALAACDIVLMMYCTKVGSYTREEFETAWSRFSTSGQPRILVYRHDRAIFRHEQSRDELASLQAFEDRLQELRHFESPYGDVPDLLLKLTEQLEKLRAEGRLEPGANGPGPETGASASHTPVRDIQPYLTRRAAHWRERAAGQLDRRFVNLTLMVDRGKDFDGPRHETLGQYELLSDLLTEHADIRAWVLVGLPGSGKSTVLQHHEMRTADAALAALAQAGDGAAQACPEICIWHRLSEYHAERSPPPSEWLASASRWPQDLPPAEALRGKARVRFLLDGLNEIKATNRAQQLEAIDSWTAWAAAEAARGDGLAPVFSVRTLDQSPMGSPDFEVRQIVLAPWTAAQIEAYCSAKLGPGNALWPAIQADASLMELSQLPFNLWAQCELYGTLGRAARSRAELLGGLFWQMLSRRVNDAPLKVPGLLGEADRRHIASGNWKATLLALPEREGCLVPWLDDTMRRLLERGRQVSLTADELLAGLPAREGWATPAQWLYAVRSLQLIDEGGHDEFSTEPLLRCTHQLWQEFFAGRSIRDWPQAQAQAQRLNDWLPRLEAPELPALDATLARLGVQEALPPPDPTHWEEPVKLAVQLVRDPRPWIATLQTVNLALAGRAAVACRNRLDDPTLSSLRDALLARSRVPAVDVRQRIEAGLVLGELGDPRYETREGPHGRYRWPKHWVTVPAGRYRIGDDHAPYGDEKPETDVDLPSFAMAFAPVTNAEYRCFIEAGGYQDERWWVGETAKRWLKTGVRNEAEIERVGGLLKKAREDVEGLLRANPQLPDSQREWWRERASESEQEHDELLDQWYGARCYELPQEWRNPVFNNPAQPVVGICQFEAMAYACWLSAQSGEAIRLPMEAEWETAARGARGRPWPWGQPAPGRWQINADPAHLRRTSPVGVFPQGDTAEGLADIAGNVWEWTTSAFTVEGLDPEALAREATDGLARRVVRGGSWFSPAVFCRPSHRFGYSPVNRNDLLGFRLVVSCPIQRPEP